MNKKCPFIWYCIKKWRIISTSINANRLYSHNLYQYYNNKRVDRVNRIYYSNDFNGYVSPTDSLNADTTQLIDHNRRVHFLIIIILIIVIIILIIIMIQEWIY